MLLLHSDKSLQNTLIVLPCMFAASDFYFLPRCEKLQQCIIRAAQRSTEQRSAKRSDAKIATAALMPRTCAGMMQCSSPPASGTTCRVFGLGSIPTAILLLDALLLITWALGDMGNNGAVWWGKEGQLGVSSWRKLKLQHETFFPEALTIDHADLLPLLSHFCFNSCHSSWWNVCQLLAWGWGNDTECLEPFSLGLVCFLDALVERHKIWKTKKMFASKGLPGVYWMKERLWPQFKCDND